MVDAGHCVHCCDMPLVVAVVAAIRAAQLSPVGVHVVEAALISTCAT
jgi:hypothetical protein